MLTRDNYAVSYHICIFIATLITSFLFEKSAAAAIMHQKYMSVLQSLSLQNITREPNSVAVRLFSEDNTVISRMYSCHCSAGGRAVSSENAGEVLPS